MGRDCLYFRNALKSHVFEWFFEATRRIVLFLNTHSSRRKEQAEGRDGDKIQT